MQVLVDEHLLALRRRELAGEPSARREAWSASAQVALDPPLDLVRERVEAVASSRAAAAAR